MTANRRSCCCNCYSCFFTDSTVHAISPHPAGSSQSAPGTPSRRTRRRSCHLQSSFRLLHTGPDVSGSRELLAQAAEQHVAAAPRSPSSKRVCALCTRHPLPPVKRAEPGGTLPPSKSRVCHFASLHPAAHFLRPPRFRFTSFLEV